VTRCRSFPCSPCKPRKAGCSNRWRSPKRIRLAAAALLSITLAPILMGFFIRGKNAARGKRTAQSLPHLGYHPVIEFCDSLALAMIVTAGLIVAWVFLPWNWLVTKRLASPSPLAEKIGKLFPFQNLVPNSCALYEGICFTCPTTFPGIGPTQARQILSKPTKSSEPLRKVHTVFGKIGRAETPLTQPRMDMVETTIQLKDEKEWPEWIYRTLTAK